MKKLFVLSGFALIAAAALVLAGSEKPAEKTCPQDKSAAGCCPKAEAKADAAKGTCPMAGAKAGADKGCCPVAGQKAGQDVVQSKEKPKAARPADQASSR